MTTTTKTNRRRSLRFTGPLAALVLLSMTTSTACTNPEVPAGFDGYVYHVPLMFGKMEFRRPLRGAASTGMSWRLYTINVDARANSYTENFQLLTNDNLSVSFEVDTRIQLRKNKVQEIVEMWGGEKWYDWNVKEPLRTIVRETVTLFSATDIQLKTDKVRDQIQKQLVAKYGDTPIDIISVSVGEIRFPEKLTKAIRRKIAQKQELERQEFVLAKTRKEAAIRVLEALRVAKQQLIISSTLDPLYVQQRAVQVYRALAKSPNKTIIMLPNTDDGTGMPLVLSKGNKKILTASDEKLLADMEARYMKIAGEPVPETVTPKPAPAEPEPAVTPPEGSPAKDGAAPAKTDAPAPAPAKPAAP